jgi:hypothetical protein
MIKFIGLVRTTSGVVHSFRNKKHLKTLCGFNFGLNEKIMWGNQSLVNCEECQQILNNEQLKINHTNEDLEELENESEVYNC